MDTKPGRPLWVIQTAFLGDIVLSLPFLYELERITQKTQNPIIFITTPVGQEILNLALARGLSHAQNRIHVQVWNKKSAEGNLFGILGLIQKLKQKWNEKPQKVFCLQRSFRSGFLAWASGAETRIGFSSGSSGNIFYNQNVMRSWDLGRHEIEKNLDLLRESFLEEKIDSWVVKDSISLLGKQGLKSKIPASKNREETTVALSLGSPWGTKRWPAQNAIELVKKLTREGVLIKFLGDSSVEELGEIIQKEVPSLLFENLTGKTTIPEWIDQISQCDFLVSGDSAAVHAASDLGIPVLALFGPTLPEFGFAPWRKGSRVLGIKNLDCRPCHIHGPKTCPKGHHKCMKELGAEEVYSYFQQPTGPLG